MKETCATCRWNDGGLCRRMPPVMVPSPTDNQSPITYVPAPSWPHIDLTDWCGEYRSERDDGRLW